MRGTVVAVAMLAMLPNATRADELSDLKAALISATDSIKALQKRVQALEAEKANAAASSRAAAEMKPKSAASSKAAAETTPKSVELKSANLVDSAPLPIVKAQPALPAAPPAPVVAPGLLPVIRIPGAEAARLEIRGAVELDAIYDAKKTDPNWEGTLRPSKIPVNCPPVGNDPGCGKNGVTNFNVRASSLDIRGFMPTAELGEVKTQLAFDLWGGADQGETRFRLTQAWLSFGQFLFGYTNSVFMDGSVFPNIVDFWGPSGMIFVRDPQIRWTPYDNDGMKVVVALEVPSAAIDEGKAAELDICSPLPPFPCFSPPLDVQARPRYPDITGQFRMDGSWGHVQLAGVARWITFDNPLGIGGNPANTVFGYGGNLTAEIKTFGQDSIKGQIAYGPGIAAYSNDCCFDLGPNASLHAVALPLLDWFIYYDHWWNTQWSSSIGFSENNQTNSAGQLDTEQHIGYYASANLLYYPAKNVTVGVEGLWGERININGAKAPDERIQFTTRVKF